MGFSIDISEIQYDKSLAPATVVVTLPTDPITIVFLEVFDLTTENQLATIGSYFVPAGVYTYSVSIGSASTILIEGHRYSYATSTRFFNQTVRAHATIGYYTGKRVLIFDANGGSNPPSELVSYWGYTENTNIFGEIPNIIPARGGYKFLGWNTSPDATTAMFLPGDTLDNVSFYILYAVWERITPPLYIKVNEGWKTATDIKVKVNGEWKTATDIKVKVNGEWKTAT